MIKASTTPTDHARAVRMVIAWLDDDQLALDTVALDATADKLGTTGLMYSLTFLAATFGLDGRPDVRDQLRALLLPKPPADDADDQDQA